MSSNLRFNDRRDHNEREIIEALESVGCSVQKLRDGPDLLVGRMNTNYLLEVKNGNRGLNAKQAEWHAAWRGQKAVVRNIKEALAAVGIPS